jgi:Ca2+-binding EF-hand superfamily protein
MADKIVNGLGFPVTRKITFNDYCDTLDGFLNQPVREQKRLAFKLYDFDDDGFVTQKDVQTMLIALGKTECREDIE